MKRVKYVSQFARDLSPEEIQQLVRLAAEKNARMDVTGILMTSGRLFYQILEGPTAHVDQIYQSILQDDRHSHVLVLESEGGVKKRFFPDWSMRMVDLDEDSHRRLGPAREMLLSIIDKQREIRVQKHSLERAIWDELASSLEE